MSILGEANGQCSMFNGQWSMFNVQWSMVNVQWLTFNGQWSMFNGLSPLASLYFTSKTQIPFTFISAFILLIRIFAKKIHAMKEPEYYDADRWGIFSGND